jgi:GWxTD domain-containing protein
MQQYRLKHCKVCENTLGFNNFMRPRILNIACSLFVLLLVESLQAQVEFSRSINQPETDFSFDAVSVSSDIAGKTRVDVYVEVPYHQLHFVKNQEVYVCNYEASVQFLEKNKQVADQRTWENEVRTKDFDQTTSDKLKSLTHQILNIDPGTYEIDVQVYDPETQKRTMRRNSIIVTDFGKDELSFSDIMLVNKLTKVGDKTGVMPNVSGDFIRQHEGFYLFFEAYHVSPIDSMELVCHIYDSQKSQMWKKEQMEPPTDSKMQLFIKVDSLNFPAGIYTVVIEGYNARSGSNPDLKATTSRAFSVHWADMPITILDLDKAIEELRYVAKGNELDSIENAKTLDEKKSRFLAFWNKRNPDASSGRNPLMEEYYRRVHYANKEFTHYIEGWKTDRGMVYIRLGPPENIERHPFEMSAKPYEIWYYYQLDRECIFIDYSGFGDYRLQNPTADLFRGLR